MPVVRCANSTVNEPEVVHATRLGPGGVEKGKLQIVELFASRPSKSETSRTHIPAGVPPIFAAWFAIVSTLPESPSELQRVTPGAGERKLVDHRGASGRVTSTTVRQSCGASCARYRIRRLSASCWSARPSPPSPRPFRSLWPTSSMFRDSAFDCARPVGAPRTAMPRRAIGAMRETVMAADFMLCGTIQIVDKIGGTSLIVLRVALIASGR